MWVLPDDLRAQVVSLQPSHFDNDRGLWALKVGAPDRLMGDEAKAESFGEIAANEYAKIVQRYPTMHSRWSSSGRPGFASIRFSRPLAATLASSAC